jgi:DNA replication protein
MSRTVDQLVRIAAAGGGFTLDAATKTVEQVVRIAAAASTKGAQITITNAQTKTVDHLVRIAAAGKGCVIFDFVE